MRSRALGPLLRFLRPFSSSPSSVDPAAADKFLTVVGSGGGGNTGDCAAYCQSMLRRPETVNRWGLRRNLCSFIGTVVRPVKRFGESTPRPGAYTFLEVKTRAPPRDPESDSSFQILLAMQDKLSEISLRHLKENDYIYVSGRLDSYEKVDESGKLAVFYKVAVKELNYVKCNNQSQKSEEPNSPRAEKLVVSISSAFDREEEYRNRLHLWQVLFANPYEWWDNRQRKKNPRMPDFKHKDTKECLWINPNDPPWVRKQLELYDSQMAGIRRDNQSQTWKPDDLE